MSAITHFIQRLDAQPLEIQFADFLDLIEQHYEFSPVAFSNGSAENSSEQNQGSAKVLAFGRLNGLSESQTLTCFGEHYRSVLATPEGADHQNIRQFMVHGWAGVSLPSDCLVEK